MPECKEHIGLDAWMCQHKDVTGIPPGGRKNYARLSFCTCFNAT